MVAGSARAQEPKPPTLAPEEQRLAQQAVQLNIEGGIFLLENAP